MSTTESVEVDVYALQARITQLQSAIRQMKKDGAPAADIATEVEKLTTARAKYTDMMSLNKTDDKPFNRKAFDELILRKMYVVPSFEIHNGPAGLFDYGPPACTLKANVLAMWRRHFVLEENMLEMECTNLTPSSVLEASGHVERFTDFMVKDEVTGDCFRADKLLEDVIDHFLATNPLLPPDEQERHRVTQRQAGAMDAEQLQEHLTLYNVKSPTNPTHSLTKPFAFNLMFRTTIGPEGTAVGFLRPETAQGLFVNFRRLLDYNQQKMPFAAAQIGLGFRNEIAPRNGLLRVREFTMAEIEHFVHPQRKQHPKFRWVRDKELVLFPADAQLGTGRTVVMTAGQAVEAGVVNNETLAYFMARTQLFLEAIGVDPKRMRFRQHLRTEMSHYAADCWDMEIQSSYGWVECVGHADRSCYDLTQHAAKTGVALVASERLAQPIQVERVVAEANKKLLGPAFKTQQKAVLAAIEALDETQVLTLRDALASSGRAVVGDGFELTAEMVAFKSEKKTVVEQKYTPSVIEPSFGIGRILYSLLEHAFSQRSADEQRCVMAFRPRVAPIKVGLFRLVNHAPFDVVIEELRQSLSLADVAVRVDSSSGSVGRRYARADELGIPFGVTVDFQTLVDQSVTLRERDSMAQVRLPLSALLPTLTALVTERVTWETVSKRFMVVKVSEADDDEDAAAAAAAAAGPAGGASAEAAGNAATTLEVTPRAAFSRPAAAQTR